MISQAPVCNASIDANFAKTHYGHSSVSYRIDAGGMIATATHERCMKVVPHSQQLPGFTSDKNTKPHGTADTVPSSGGPDAEGYRLTDMKRDCGDPQLPRSPKSAMNPMAGYPVAASADTQSKEFAKENGGRGTQENSVVDTPHVRHGVDLRPRVRVVGVNGVSEALRNSLMLQALTQEGDLEALIPQVEHKMRNMPLPACLDGYVREDQEPHDSGRSVEWNDNAGRQLQIVIRS
mmetsp:Transcript_10555/g.25621  ORF Transcript_10555/g.25621 Transcript_10555/m.25621 type:complete len:235 (-) Transcript_10555:105-809(-)